MSTRPRSLCCQQQSLRRLAEMDRVGGSALPTELGPPQWLLIIPGGGRGTVHFAPNGGAKADIAGGPSSAQQRTFTLLSTELRKENGSASITCAPFWSWSANFLY